MVYDVDADRAKSLADDFRGSVAATEDELVARSDVVWICTPPTFHRNSVELVAAAGKAIFCEKPLATTLEDVEGIERAVEAANVPFFMGQSGRWSDVFRRMKAAVEAGKVGEVTEAWCVRQGYLDRKVHPAWRFDDAASGGVVVELGVHEIDFLRWIGGDWQQLAAVGSSRGLNPGKFLDSISAIGYLDVGAQAMLELSWAEPRYLWQRGVRGTEGSLFLDDMRFTKLELWRPGKSEPEIIEARNWKDDNTGENLALGEQAAGVFDCLLHNRPFPVSLEDGAAAVRTALGIRDSVQRSWKAVPKAGGKA